jgi:integrase
VDVSIRVADGTRYRERRRFRVTSKVAATRWGQERERYLLVNGPPRRKEVVPVPILSEFAPRFLEGHARANRQKPSGIAAKETIIRVHLVPLLGSKRLDAITNEDAQRVKSRLTSRAAKTVNNVLTVLNTMLKKAVEWGVIERMPCTVRLLPMPAPTAGFHDFDTYERLVTSAEELDWRAHLIVLLGGDAGLRCGEIIGLEWDDVDLNKRQVCVRRSEWKGQVTAPKSGRHRFVPLTTRLAAALRANRHLRTPRVLHQDDRSPLTQKIVQDWMRRTARRARVDRAGVHILRHTFCATPSAPISPCAARRRGPFKSWPATKTSPRPSATCT